MFNRVLTITAATLALAAGGCTYFSPGNPLSSRDEYNYPSTSVNPQTVVLRDLRTDQVLYTWEVPVDQKLFVRFLEAKGDKAQGVPDQCEWLFYPITTWDPPLANRQRFNVPPADARRLDLFIRSNPELPATMKPAGVEMPPSDLPPVTTGK